MSSLIQVRIDDNLKKEADTLFSELGLDTPSAIRLFLKQSVVHNRIPFPIVKTSRKHISFEERIQGREDKCKAEEWETGTPSGDEIF